ncbi:hypothetical protein DPEC_G00097590 [Dallia pectoralis]|uniref:Uncharacterized protein n=1 Tax=Dallia pectoralis TaxID=75939 RepID=A0ACC2GVR9_DALPE|nr:hypothetical protein DPEC_G00097590 [Dallia pectoralis]
MNAALDKAGIFQWKDKVGLGTDGAAVMVGRLGGVATLLRAEVPHLINIQCLSHGLELASMDAMKDHERMRKITWSELKDLAGVLNQKVWKPTNLGGTRSASAEIIGRAKQCLQVLKDFQHIVLVQDVIKVLSSFESHAARGQLTLPEALYAFETAVLRLTAMETEAGKCEEGFLAESQNGTYQNVELLRFRESRAEFYSVKRKLLSSVVASLQFRFKGVEFQQVLQAAAKQVDPREWPADHQELASYGRDHLATV